MKTRRKSAGNAATSEIGNEMAVAEIAHAPWNPRTEAELKPDHPAMVELIDSVMALGVVQPIAVWTGDAAAALAGDGRIALCIAGNRRLEAARTVGLKTIPVKQFTSLTEEAARAITRAENECRFGVSPLADAKLIRSMVDLGRSQSEIAALVGVSEATVCRRAKLLGLVPEIVNVVDGNGVDAKSLEMIAAYPADVQKKAAKKIGERIFYGGQIKPKVVDSIFGDLTRQISRSLWIFEGEQGEARYKCCLGCSACTGNQRELFDIVDETHCENGSAEGAGESRCLGRCLNVKCFRQFEKDAERERIAAAIDKSSKGVGADGIIKGSGVWHNPYNEMKSKKRQGKDTFAYVFWDTYQHKAFVKWGPDPEVAKKAKERASAREDKKVEEYRRLVCVADKGVGAFVGFLFPHDKKGRYDLDSSREKVKKMPLDFVVSLIVERLAEVLVESCWDPGKRGLTLRFARELPEIKSLLSAEEFAALEKVVKEDDR